MSTTTLTNPKRTARIAGLLYLLLAIFGAFSILFVSSNILVEGDAAATAANIVASEGLLRAGILAGIIYQLIYVFLVLALYQLLKPVNRNQAVLMVIFVLLSVPIAQLNLINQAAALLLVSGPGYLNTFPVEQLQAAALFFMNLHGFGVIIAQVFWGLWLLPLGYLVFKSGYMPRIIGILLIVAGIGYLYDVVVFIMLPDMFGNISEFTFLGELLLMLWLLMKGVNEKAWAEQVQTLPAPLTASA